MSVVVRYFSTASAGAGDGTSWADRAALFSSGNWSSVITGFDFSASDSLECRIGPGTYTLGQTLATGIFTNAPIRANPIVLVGSDGSGNILPPVDPNWSSAQPAWDLSGVPRIEGSVGIVNLAHCVLYNLHLIVGTGSANPVVDGGARAAWCVLEHLRTSNVGGCIIGTAYNCVGLVKFADIFSGVFSGIAFENCRAEGNAAATTNNRNGFDNGGNNAAYFNRCTAVNLPGAGFANRNASQASPRLLTSRSLAYNCGTGFRHTSTGANNNETSAIERCVAINSAGYGIEGTTAPTAVIGGRYRNNTSGNFNGLGNGPDIQVETGSGTDADEFVNAAGGDFRIKNTSAIWGLGVGPADEPAPASGGGGTRAWWG